MQMSWPNICYIIKPNKLLQKCCKPDLEHCEKSKMDDEHPAVTLFREYLQIKSVQPNPDYDACLIFLRKQAERLGLVHHTTEMVKGKPIFIMTWQGTEPNLPALLLNSHTDVVPVFPESWKYDPFEAVKEKNGDIYARGSQDMKCVGIQYIEAIYKLKVLQKKSFRRTIHLCFIADEEIGGHDGMKKFVVSKEFKILNIGFALDEGLASPDNTIPLFYGQRSAFQIEFKCTGNPGHGSRFIENTAAEKVQYLMNKLLNFRSEQKKIFESDENLTLGDVTTVNLTYMAGGVQMNVVPNEFVVWFDMRITPSTPMDKFEAMIMQWVAEAGSGIEVKFKNKHTDQTMTSVAESDKWYQAFMKGAAKHELEITPRIFPAGTDSRYIRAVGIPSFGFSPMNNTPVLLHDHNEFLNENVFLKGIDIFSDIIAEMASV